MDIIIPRQKKITGEWASRQEVPIHIETFPSAEAFLFHYAEDRDFDILLLDIEMGESEQYLKLELSGEMVRIPFREIRYLEVRQNYVTLHAGEEYTVKRSLGEFERELDARFCRVGPLS